MEMHSVSHFFKRKKIYIYKKKIQKLRRQTWPNNHIIHPWRVLQKWYKNKCFTDKYTSAQSSEPDARHEIKLQKKATCKRQKIQTRLFFCGVWIAANTDIFTDHMPIQEKRTSITTLLSTTNSLRSERQRRVLVTSEPAVQWRQPKHHESCRSQRIWTIQKSDKQQPPTKGFINHNTKPDCDGDRPLNHRRWNQNQQKLQLPLTHIWEPKMRRTAMEVLKEHIASRDDEDADGCYHSPKRDPGGGDTVKK